MLLPLVGSTGFAVLKAQPALVAYAASQPDASVRVIARMTVDAAPAAALVESLGGEYLRELALIDAFAAQMTAATAVRLATSPAIGWVSLDAPVVTANGPGTSAVPANTFLQTIGADALHAAGLDGTGVTVAVVDSGITEWDDFEDADGDSRILDWVMYSNGREAEPEDLYGHGTHVAATIGGTGSISAGLYGGVAPGVNLLNVKISNGQGMSYMSDVVAGLEWVFDHQDDYDIRVVNLSLNSTVAESYHTSPLNAALEILWFNGIVVVVSAGNNGAGSGILYPPANDPFVITVGASDEMDTGAIGDDVMASYSAYGLTGDGFDKPDIVAPGSGIISLLGGDDSWLAINHPDRLVEDDFRGDASHFRLSGTSMAAAVTSGAAALLLQDEPSLTPDQVKYRLVQTGHSLAAGGYLSPSYYPYLDIEAAVNGTTTASANVGVAPSLLIASGNGTIVWTDVAWNSVAWNSVAWNSVAWND